MPINVRQKGRRGEQELVRMAKAKGLKAVRTAPIQAGVGTSDCPDVRIEDYAVEAKCREDNPARLWDWLRFNDMLALKRNGQGWLVVMRLEAALDLIAEAKEGKDAK